MALLHVQIRDTVILIRVINTHTKEGEVQQVFNLGGLRICASVGSEKLDSLLRMSLRDHFTFNLCKRFAGNKFNFGCILLQFEERCL